MENKKNLLLVSHFYLQRPVIKPKTLLDIIKVPLLMFVIKMK